MAASQDEDLQEVFCSLACLSGAVFTSAVIGNWLSCTGVCVCVCVIQNLYHDLSPETEKILEEI